MKQIHQISNQNQTLSLATWSNDTAVLSPKQIGIDIMFGGEVRFENRDYSNKITGKYMC
jgi:hypothetical protein